MKEIRDRERYSETEIERQRGGREETESDEESRWKELVRGEESRKMKRTKRERERERERETHAHTHTHNHKVQCVHFKDPVSTTIVKTTKIKENKYTSTCTTIITLFIISAHT